MSEPLYQACPVCQGRKTVAHKVGIAPIQVYESVECPACKGEGVVPAGVSLEQVEDLQVRAAAHDVILRAAIRPFDLRGRTRWRIVAELGAPRHDHYESFEAARDVIYRAVGLGRG